MYATICYPNENDIQLKQSVCGCQTSNIAVLATEIHYFWAMTKKTLIKTSRQLGFFISTFMSFAGIPIVQTRRNDEMETHNSVFMQTKIYMNKCECAIYGSLVLVRCSLARFNFIFIVKSGSKPYDFFFFRFIRYAPAVWCVLWACSTFTTRAWRSYNFDSGLFTCL